MTNKIKALGVTLAAVFAVSAVAAPAAMAQTGGHFFSHAANEKTHIHGEQNGGVFTITAEGGNLTVTCPDEDVTFTGTPSDTEGNPVEPSQTASDVRVHPVYSPETAKNCSVKIGETNFGKAIVHTEGCDYVLSANTNAEGHAPVHIVCESTGEGEATETHEITITGALGCVIHVGPQTPERGVHYENENVTEPVGEQEPESIIAKATVTGIHATTTNCPGIPETVEDAHYESEITVTGYEDKSDEEGSTADHRVSIKWTAVP